MDHFNLNNKYEPNDVNLVKIDDIVLLKIMKHASSCNDKFFLGCLHGFKNKDVIEITSCYPYLPDTFNEDAIAEYDKEMTRSLVQMNLENFKVGWYQISFQLDNFVSYETYENQLNSIFEIPFFIYLSFDILDAESGSATPFKAYKLNEEFVQLHNKKVKVEDLQQYTSKYDKVFVQIPVQIMSNPLNQLFIETYKTELQKRFTVSSDKPQTFSTSHLMEKNTYCLTDAIEEQLELTNKLNEHFLQQTNPNVEKVVESIDVIDNLHSLQRLNNFTDRITTHSQFIQDSNYLIKQIVE